MKSAAPNLLVADDDAALRAAVVELVEPYCRPIAVASAEAALKVVASCEIQLALCDMYMEALSGLDFIRQVRRLQREFPCILMSGDLNDDILHEAEELEAFSVLSKPLSRKSLLDTIQRAIEL